MKTTGSASASSKGSATATGLNYSSLSATGADDANGFTITALSLITAGGLFGLVAASKRRRAAARASQN
ncbi:hypothetical protein [Okibacterium fritillariae]|uniref:hypothetical protein n=1 Tax=Okibacterium fritillariae TaxID=123320 RepID=UPI00117C4497|nr:hypothetical protein [Okibacterium fritillariae]